MAFSLLATTRGYRHNDRVLSQGQRGDRVIIVERGNLKIVASAADGREVFLAVRGPGELVGELSYFDGRPRVASAVAVGKVAALVIDFASFGSLLVRYPRAAHEVACSISGKLYAADRRRMEFGFPVVRRVASVLSEIASAGGVEVVFTQRELAQLVGAAEVSVQKALRKLAAEGLVTRRYGRIVVRRPAELARIVGWPVQGTGRLGTDPAML